MSDLLEQFIDYSIRNKQGNQHYPPTEKEIRELISFLRANDLDPVIVGSMALVKHLSKSERTFDAESFRATDDVDIFVKNTLPNPPPGWSRDRESIGVISWISPKGGYVDFLVANDEYPDGSKNPSHIDIDPASINSDFPLADITSVFLMKLNSWRNKDLYDLIDLVGKVEIPRELRFKDLTRLQLDNLQLIESFVAAAKNR